MKHVARVLQHLWLPESRVASAQAMAPPRPTCRILDRLLHKWRMAHFRARQLELREQHCLEVLHRVAGFIVHLLL